MLQAAVKTPVPLHLRPTPARLHFNIFHSILPLSDFLYYLVTKLTASNHPKSYKPPGSISTMAAELATDAESYTAENNEPSRPGSSSSSFSEHSDTSTIRYDQEPWTLYRNRVEQLCKTLWPQRETMKSRLFDNKLFTRLRANKIFRALTPSARKPLVERFEGGDYNRITAITLPSHDAASPRQLILRAPREKNLAHPDRDVAILKYVRQHSSIPVAVVAGHDFSCNNPLDSPYVLQDRVPGEDLEKLWPKLTHAQRRTVAIEMGQVVRSLLSLEAQTSGILEAPAVDSGVSAIVPFELKNALGEALDEQPGTSRECRTTLELLTTHFNRWRAVDLDWAEGEITNEIQLWDSLLAIVEDFKQMGLFPQSLKNCFCHVDLHPRNIMVDIGSDSSLKVTAILDWDEAVFAPKFVNCRPPLWLWDDNVDDQVDEDGMDPWPYELPGANDVPSSPEKKELKQIFEEHAGTEFCRMAYEDVFRLGRVLFHLAIFGLVSSENWRAAERVVKDWEVLRPSFE